MDYVSKIQIPGGSTYNITGVIPMGSVASTSTSTVYTATISGITELKNGVCVWLTNGVITSAANFTININGLGAKPVYRSNAATTRETTRFDKNYTIFLIYNETRVSGGCWDYVYGYDSNTTYTNMTQTEASAGTATTGRVISAKVLSDTIEQHTAEINAVLPELVDEGAKNKFNINSINTAGSYNYTYSVVSKTLLVSSTGSYGRLSCMMDLAASSYVLSCNVSDVTIVGGTSEIRIASDGSGSPTIVKQAYSAAGSLSLHFELAQDSTVFIMFYVNLSSSNYANSAKFSDIMLCTESEYNISQKYAPYALPNPELTAATIETVNNGAKNEFCFDSVGTIINDDYICAKQFSANGVTFTLNADNTITATRTESSNYDSGCILMYNGKPAYIDSFFDAAHIVSGCPAGGTANTYSIGVSTKAVGPDSGVYELGDGLFLPPKEEVNWDNMFLNIRYSSSYSGTITYKPMICTIPQWNISREYQPYALPNSELTAATIEAINDGVKNWLKITASSETINGITFTVNTDGTVVANGTATANATFMLATSDTYNLPVGKYILSGCVGGSATTYDLRFWQGGSTKVNYDEGTEITVTSAEWNYAILIRSGQTVSGLVFRPMICTKAEWDVSQKYASYALPNPKLTAATIEMIDNGPKNLLNHTAYTRTVNKVTYTVNDDRSITITSNGTNTQSLLYLVQNYTGVPAGNYVLSGCTGGSSTKYDLRVKVGNTTYINYGGGTEFYYNGTDSFEASIVVRASQTVNITMKPMICTKADWNVSHEYQPYRPEKVSLQQAYSDGTLIATNANLNDYTTAGLYYATVAVASTLTHTPYKATGFRLVVEKNSLSGAAIFQTIVPTSQTSVSKTYKRVYENDAWGNWYVLSGPKATIQGVDEYIYGTGTELASDANLNHYNYVCKMYSPSAAVSATISNTPWTASGFQLITVQFITTASYMQFLLPNTTTGKWYRRRYGSGTWSSWVEFDAASYLIIGATAIASNTDLNNLKTPGIYTCASASVAGTLTHCPYKSSGFRCDIIQTSDTNCIRQIIQPNQMTTNGGNARYERSCVISSSTWSSWYKFEGTVVT